MLAHATACPPLLQIFRDNPEALCTEIVLQDGDNKVYYHYLVQDTPGEMELVCTTKGMLAQQTGGRRPKR